MDNYNLLPDNEVREVDNRRYINPNLAVNETNTFIDNYRNNQRANTQEIASQTQALGTNVPSNIGGLTGAGSYFASRYQTPQTNAVTQNLRTVAQQTALNEALANEQAMWKKRYQDAYNAYQKRQNDKQNTNTTDDTTKGGQETEDTTMTIEGDVPGTPDGYTTALFDTETGKILGYSGVPYGEDGKTEYRTYLDSYDADSTRQKISKGVSGNDTTYSYTLPNGNTVAVDENRFTLVRNGNGKYALKDKNTGEEHPVGG